MKMKPIRINIDQTKISSAQFGYDESGEPLYKSLKKDYDYVVIPYTEMELACRRHNNHATSHLQLMLKSKIDKD